jgi:hypothetical protein
MKSIKHVLLAIISSLLLTAGFAKAAESFDVVATHFRVESVKVGPGGRACVISE